MPPTACARPIHARAITGGLSTSSTYRRGAGAALLRGAGSDFLARDEGPDADARDLLVGLLLLAIPPR
ncbi:hypothetical protein GCM10027071_24410 [Microbacterium marinum]